MKNTMRKAMLSTIAMLVVAVMSLTGVTYAWFSASTTADVTGMTMNVAAADGGLQVSQNYDPSTGNGSWSSKVTFTAMDENLALNPVSTVDAETFFTAEVDADVATTITAALDESGNNVWTNTFYAKNTGYEEITVGLDTGDVFSDLDETDSKQSFLAARVAIFVDDTLAYIYGDTDTNIGVVAAGKIENCFTEQDGKVETPEKLVDSIDECTFKLDGLDEDGNEVPTKITVVIWVEGQDADCINKNAADKFAAELNLVVVD